jgi:hypothetical protein
MSNSDREPKEHECFPDCGCDTKSPAPKNCTCADGVRGKDCFDYHGSPATNKCEHKCNDAWTKFELIHTECGWAWKFYPKSDYPTCPICPAPKDKGVEEIAKDLYDKVRFYREEHALEELVHAITVEREKTREAEIQIADHEAALKAKEEEIAFIMKMADGTDNFLLVSKHKWEELQSQVKRLKEYELKYKELCK